MVRTRTNCRGPSRFALPLASNRLHVVAADVHPNCVGRRMLVNCIHLLCSQASSPSTASGTRRATSTWSCRTCPPTPPASTSPGKHQGGNQSLNREQIMHSLCYRQDSSPRPCASLRGPYDVRDLRHLPILTATSVPLPGRSTRLPVATTRPRPVAFTARAVGLSCF